MSPTSKSTNQSSTKIMKHLSPLAARDPDPAVNDLVDVFTE